MINSGLSAAGGFDLTDVVSPAIPVVASAATIRLSSLVTRITGAVAIANITPPNAYFTGPLWLLSTDAAPFTTVATGNIALATTGVRYKLLALAFDTSTNKWYPSY